MKKTIEKHLTLREKILEHIRDAIISGSLKAGSRVKVIGAEPLKKPDWIRVKAPTSEGYKRTRDILREKKLVTVCEEAGCPTTVLSLSTQPVPASVSASLYVPGTRPEGSSLAEVKPFGPVQTRVLFVVLPLSVRLPDCSVSEPSGSVRLLKASIRPMPVAAASSTHSPNWPRNWPTCCSPRWSVRSTRWYCRRLSSCGKNGWPHPGGYD